MASLKEKNKNRTETDFDELNLLPRTLVVQLGKLRPEDDEFEADLGSLYQHNSN